MTPRKTPRNTTELPISVAIEKLRELNEAQRAETDVEVKKAAERILKRYETRRDRVLLRVPDALRAYVLEHSAPKS
jgi:hypothetical protein